MLHPLKRDKLAASHPILRLGCHLERHEMKWKISFDYQSPLIVIATFRFFSSFVIKRSKNLFFFILPQFKNGWTVPQSLSDRNGVTHPDHLTLTSSVQQFPIKIGTGCFCPNGALILLTSQSSFQSKIEKYYPYCDHASAKAGQACSIAS